MKTKQLLSAGLFILSLIYLSSCDELFEERIEGNNIVVTKVRTVAPFNEVISTGNFDVYITIADSSSLIIEAEENLFAFITTKVRGDKFYLEEKDNYRIDNNQAIKIFLTTPNIEGAMLTGSGFIICDSLTTDFLDLEITGSGDIEFNKLDLLEIDGQITGSGDITVWGTADRSEFTITGSGHIHGLDLLQNYCDALITGSGNIYVNVDEHLKALITGSGNIYYLGSPTIEQKITGTGAVRPY
ncbi:MAG: hypothetical protein GQ564_10825 [Bacteroidales bacterium]|nr:hypothetical protein [Bacteroidales bacterium]